MSIATTIKRIDAALVTKYSGIQVYTGTPPALTDVTVFIEKPFSEEERELVYPSISIQLAGILPDFDRSEGDEGEYEEVGYDSISDPNVREMRLLPEPYRVLYSIDSWHKVRVGEDRDLVSSALVRKTPLRSYLAATTIDDDDINLWMMWAPGLGIEEIDEVDTDMVIFHKSLSVVILAHLAQVDADDTEDELVVMEEVWGVSARKTRLTEDGLVVVDGEDVLDMEFQFNETDEGPV